MSRAIIALVISLTALPSVAHAKRGITCDGTYQIVDGRPVSTPFCQDEQLARDARKSGAKISADELRNSPDLKRKACLLVGSSQNTLACADEDR